MVATLVALIIAPVQDRAISVAEFIKSFDSESIKHVASKEMGEHIIFVHAPNEKEEEVKAKLAEALSASWRKTETGFRLERTQGGTNELKRKETAVRAQLYKIAISVTTNDLSDFSSAEERNNAALQNLLKHQETFRTTRPTSFQRETLLPADWLLLSFLRELDVNSMASMQLSHPLEMSTDPVGDQVPLPSGFAGKLSIYERDRQELSGFADTIVESVGEGPLTSWVKDRLGDFRELRPVGRVTLSVARFPRNLFASVNVYDRSGEFIDNSYRSLPAVDISPQLEIPADLNATLNETQRAFVDFSYGYTFLRNPQPEAIDRILGIEPLSATEPLFKRIAEHFEKPFMVVLDDELITGIDRPTGPIKSISGFVRKAQEEGSITVVDDATWLVLRPQSLLDTEAGRFDRKAIAPFLTSTKNSGYVTLTDYLSLAAAAPFSTYFPDSCLLAYLDRHGYTLVKTGASSQLSRLLIEILRLRGGFPKEPIELTQSELSADSKRELLNLTRSGIATLLARPGQTPTALERNGHYAQPQGLRSDSIVRLTPLNSASVGLKEPFPSTYSAREIASLCAGVQKAPAEMLAQPLWFGERRGLRFEFVVNTKTMLTNEYYESASEMKEMRGYDSLPEGFRKEVEKAYEEMRTEIGR